jgi:tetratricopeptide (TPR) repeat protein
VIRGSNAFQAGDYATASRCFDAYARAGGRFGPRLAYRWGVSLLNQHRWAAAEHALLSGLTRFEGQPTVAVQPRTMLALGLCRYYLGRLDAAAATLEVVQEKSLYAPRSYILGRIHEARGDARGAEALYAAVAERAPLFIPAAYQLVRLKMAAGEPEAAKTILAHAAGAKGRDADFDGLAGVIARNETPLPKEFVVVLKD